MSFPRLLGRVVHFTLANVVAVVTSRFTSLVHEFHVGPGDAILVMCGVGDSAGALVSSISGPRVDPCEKARSLAVVDPHNIFYISSLAHGSFS